MPNLEDIGSFGNQRGISNFSEQTQDIRTRSNYTMNHTNSTRVNETTQQTFQQYDEKNQTRQEIKYDDFEDQVDKIPQLAPVQRRIIKKIVKRKKQQIQDVKFNDQHEDHNDYALVKSRIQVIPSGQGTIEDQGVIENRLSIDNKDIQIRKGRKSSKKTKRSKSRIIDQENEDINYENDDEQERYQKVVYQNIGRQDNGNSNKKGRQEDGNDYQLPQSLIQNKRKKYNPAKKKGDKSYMRQQIQQQHEATLQRALQNPLTHERDEFYDRSFVSIPDSNQLMNDNTIQNLRSDENANSFEHIQQIYALDQQQGRSTVLTTNQQLQQLQDDFNQSSSVDQNDASNSDHQNQEQSSENISPEQIRVNQLSLEAYIQYRKERQKRIHTEIFNFIWINFIYMAFFAFLLARQTWLSQMNCEISLVVFIIYHVSDKKKNFEGQDKYQTRSFKQSSTLFQYSLRFKLRVVDWPFWCGLAVHVIFIIFITGLFLYSLVCYCRGEFSWQCLIANFWAILISVGFGLAALNSILIFISKNPSPSDSYSLTGESENNSNNSTSHNYNKSSQNNTLISEQNSTSQISGNDYSSINDLALIWIPVLYLLANILSTFLLMPLLTIWFEKLLYQEDRVQVTSLQRELTQESQENEQTLKIYKFKAPAFLKKMTNTYFKKSHKKDLKLLKKKIHQIKRQYRSKQTNMSFNLEDYLHQKDLQKLFNKQLGGNNTNTLGGNYDKETEQKIIGNHVNYCDGDQVVFRINTNGNLEDNQAIDNQLMKQRNSKKGARKHAVHLSISSANQLRKLGDKFMQDYPLVNLKKSQNAKIKHKTLKFNDTINDTKKTLLNTNTLNDSCSTVQLKECLICMSSISDAVIMPCGHGGVCYECAQQILQKGVDSQKCHLCREYIEQVLKIDVNTIFKDYIRVIESSQVAYKGQTLSINNNHNINLNSSNVDINSRRIRNAVSNRVDPNFINQSHIAQNQQVIQSQRNAQIQNNNANTSMDQINHRYNSSDSNLQINEGDLEPEDMDIIIEKFNEQYEILNPLMILQNSLNSYQGSMINLNKSFSHLHALDLNYKATDINNNNNDNEEMCFDDPKDVYFGRDPSLQNINQSQNRYQLSHNKQGSNNLNQQLQNQLIQKKIIVQETEQYKSQNSQKSRKGRNNMLAKVIENVSQTQDSQTNKDFTRNHNLNQNQMDKKIFQTDQNDSKNRKRYIAQNREDFESYQPEDEENASSQIFSQKQQKQNQHYYNQIGSDQQPQIDLMSALSDDMRNSNISKKLKQKGKTKQQ
eukprot:403375897